MENISTEIGKIYASYNEETDDFDKYRVVSISSDNKYTIGHLNSDYKIDDEDVKVYTEDEYRDFRLSHTLLASDGIMSISAIVAAKRENGTDIKDIAILFFPNTEETRIPDIKKPYIVARQAINNIFAMIAGQEDVAGVSVSLDTLPNGYTLGDFMDNIETLSSKLMHIYKIDTPDSMSFILDSEDIESILKELYNKALWMNQNIGKIDEKYEVPENDCINGYCNSLKRFITESGYYEDLLIQLNIVPIDKELEEKVALDEDDKLLLATLCGGGIHIEKAIPIRFDYDINLNAIRMRYLLARNVNGEGNVYIVPYTVSPLEIDTEPLYKISEEQTNKLQARLKEIVKAYDDAKAKEAQSTTDFTTF